MVEFARLPDIEDLGYHEDTPGAPAWYWRNLSADVFGPHIVLRCVHGVGATLGKHAMAADGTITPSLVWMRWDSSAKKDVEGCCHVWGRLLGWTPADAARRG